MIFVQNADEVGARQSRGGCGGAEQRILIRGSQFGELGQTLGHSRDVPQLNQVHRLEHVHHPVAPDLSDDGLHSVQGRVLERQELEDQS